MKSTTADEPTVAKLREHMRFWLMKHFSDKLSMEEIATACYDAFPVTGSSVVDAIAHSADEPTKERQS